MELKQYLAERADMVNTALDAALPPPEAEPRRLHEAMRYTVFPGGKRLRPGLCLLAAEAVGRDPACAMPAAVAVELLHTYTLIHDDLPCMDDDDLRRGRPTCHKVYGEANAVLAGDALQALAFGCLAQAPPPAPYAPGRLVQELAEAAGSRGVIGGQVVDIALAAGETPPARDVLDYVHLHKTALLFRAALRMGAMAAGADPNDLERLTTYGTNVGLAFQLTDDLLDAAEPGQDQEIASYLAIVPPHELRGRTEALVEQAVSAVTALGGSGAEPLASLARWIPTRRH
jgi:geranylgeranyl diphosphate synthase type II